jgi:oligogalacturonide lyase
MKYISCSFLIAVFTCILVTAADHPHLTMSPDGKKIEIQSAMLSRDNRSMNICVISIPEAWMDAK